MNDLDQQSDAMLEEQQVRPKFTWRLYATLAVPMIMFGFYAIDHNWTASQYNEHVFGIYDGTANRTADRMETVNAGSSSWRVALCVFGLVGLVCVSKPKLRVSLLLVTMMGYFGWLYLSVAWSVSPAATAYKLAVLSVFLATAFGISRPLNMEQLAIRFMIVCICYLFWGVIAEFVHGGLRLTSSEYRFTGTTHPNTNSVYAAIICLCSSIFVFRKGRSVSWTAIAAFCIGATFLLLAKSRTSMAATLLGLAIIGIIHVSPRLRVPLLACVLFFMAAAGLTMNLVGNQLKGKVGTAAAMGRKDDVTTLTGRLPLWDELGDSIADSPVIGHGYLGFWTGERVEYLSELLKWEIPHGHNMYLDVLLDGGLVGLFFYLSLFLAGLVSSTRRFFATGDRGAAFTTGLLVLVLLHGFGESLFKMPLFPTFVLMTMLFRLNWEPRLKEVVAEERVRASMASDQQLQQVGA